MIKRANLKEQAKQQIRGNIGVLFLCSLLIGLMVLFSAPILGLGFILAPAFSISMVMIYLNMTRTIRPEVGNIFDGFSIFGKALWLSIITGFFTWLWSMLFIVPGIIKSYAYSMAPYILAENPTMTAREALRESKRITHGYKADLFILHLSFIPWLLLCGITFGIAGIYVIPYMQATTANVYNQIKGDNASGATIA